MKILKYLELTTTYSSKECEKLIKDKRIKVNDKIVSKETTRRTLAYRRVVFLLYIFTLNFAKF